ncbi:MAG: ABC transporter permease, partial [Chitinophagaceae bacterium]|nr:ABC transporter permease [Chitinophagaceae bacterium]
MPVKYNQYRAMLAITKASLKAVLRSPSAVVFSIFFPLIFILVFGFIGSGGRITLNVSMDENSDTTNFIYYAIKGIKAINIKAQDAEELKRDLEKGRLTAIINIRRSQLQNTPYIIDLKSSEAV